MLAFYMSKYFVNFFPINCKIESHKYNNLYIEITLENEPLPFVTFLNAELTDSIEFDVYMAFLIFSGTSNSGSRYCMYSSTFSTTFGMLEKTLYNMV